MKAIVYHRYGGPEVLGLDEIDKPAPGDDEVLIRIRAASVNPFDWHFMRGTPWFLRLMSGLRKPKSSRLGVDVAGEVEAVGSKVVRFKAGDQVFGACRGAFAEYGCATESAVVTKPESIAFEQAACVGIAGLTALQALRDTIRIGPRQQILINGASGGVGTFAVQIAKSYGATVTGVCSTKNIDLVRSIGADQVIDYTREDFTAGAQRYDAILDCIGSRPLGAFRRILTERGVYVTIAGTGGRLLGPLPRWIRALLMSLFVTQKMTMYGAHRSQDDLTALRALMESGTLTPVIDSRYELREVPDAIRHSESGHARGKIVILVK